MSVWVGIPYVTDSHLGYGQIALQFVSHTYHGSSHWSHPGISDRTDKHRAIYFPQG